MSFSPSGYGGMSPFNIVKTADSLQLAEGKPGSGARSESNNTVFYFGPTF